MLHRLTAWLRSRSQSGGPGRRVAGWIGRNWARVSYGYRVEPTWLELNTVDIPVSGLPANFADFRIVHLSDFHCSRQVTTAYLNEAVDLAQAQQPDLVVLTGDFIHHGFRYVERVAAVLGRLTAPLGTFAVLGNHDFSVRNALGFRRYRHLHQAVADALTAQGIRVLRNEAVLLNRAGQILPLVGVEDLWSRVCDLDQALSGLSPHSPCVVLAHNPQTIDLLAGRRCDLMLSGHTHGGQVDWPGVGRPVLSKRARRFAAGLYRHQNTYLYVSKGVGFGWRFRFGVRPEVSVAVLRQADSAR